MSIGLFSCSSGNQADTSDAETTDQPATQSEDWEVLFDGSSLDKWRNFKSDSLNPQWQIEEGTLTLTGEGAGDIVTKEEYEDFELDIDWKISEGGNSGLFFHVVEADSLERVWHSGPEYQFLDNERHPDAQYHNHRAGDNYDMQAVSKETVKPAGEWNTTRLIVNNGHVEHWLNGEKVVEYELGSQAWEDSLAQSKFSAHPLYGRAGKGHIALQDHGDQVWFRNIKIKTL
jgi:hypothetical protein